MILVAIIALSLVVITALLAVFGGGLPVIPTEITDVIMQFVGIINSGAGLFWSLVYPLPVKACIGLTFTVFAIREGYDLVMWVAKKVPMFGVSD